MKLDKSKPYAEIRGSTNGERYEQYGIVFNQDGEQINKDISTSVVENAIPKQKEIIGSLVQEKIINKFLSVAEKTPKGCFVEVGVYKGGAAIKISELAEKQKRKVFLYDTFTGIPYKDAIDQHKIGDFSDTSYEEVKEAIPYAKVIQGIFPQSAVDMGKVAFVHVDCDQYRAIKETVQYLSPLMVKGGVMWFDDYGCLAGATQAVEELFGNKIEIVENKAMVRF